MEKDSEFKIRFGGTVSTIDANTLINSLIHTTSIIQELNRNLDSGKKIDIRIKALEKGSFLIHIDLIETAIESMKNLLTKDNVAFAAAILGALIDLIELKKFLGTRKPKNKERDGEQVRIENENGDIIYIKEFSLTIYENNTIIRDALAQNFETLDNDPSITDFSLTDKRENPLVTVEKDKFYEMSLKSEEISEDERILTEAATLNIVRLAFDDKLKWDFYFKGNKITAKLIDPKFYERIDNGESFAKGDTLEVELEIRQKFDFTVNTYINKSYSVKKILRHIKRGEQTNLKFDTE